MPMGSYGNRAESYGHNHHGVAKKPGKSHGEYSKGGSLRGNVTVPADCAMTRMFKGSTDQGLEVYERRMMADNYVEHPSVMEPLPHL